MDYNSNAIEIIPDASGPETWAAGAVGAAQSDQATWATEDDYRTWNAEPNLVSSSNPTPDRQYQSRSRAGSEQPPSKKARGSSQVEGSGMSKSRAIGKMFFKTKLCCKFRMGTCPYVTNCNFAHGMEELRKPPPNWQEILAAQEEGSERLELREENQIPIVTSSNVGGDGQRSLKGRHCKKFYTEEGCPYGDMCTFLHDEQSKGRESVAISLSPTVGGGGSNGVMSQKPSNWKTRICNKWEMTGYCPFGSKCHFAHGAAELLRYGGGTIGMEAGDASPTAPDSKQANISAKASSKNAVASATSIPHADAYHFGVLLQRSTIANQKQGQEQRPLQKWKGPDKISRIYGDWIDENE